jgi:glutathione synthase/RimK-type ligase-like ATP-grasp enzyme
MSSRLAALKHCAFLTYDRRPEPTDDDRLAIPHLERLGWSVEALSWRAAPARARDFDVIVIRSTWDYHHHVNEFLEALSQIEDAGVAVLNPFSLVRWNVRKTYLRDFASSGIPTVPTVYRDRMSAGELATLFDEVHADDIVAKPLVSASAFGTMRIDRRASADQIRAAEALFADRPFMAQAVVRSVLDEGEYSLIYLGGSFSHAVHKTPKPGDFRVQEEHGGENRPVNPEASLVALGDAVLATLSEPPLYARVDIVRANDLGDWWLMELELVEPALYLALGDGAAERFARAVDARVRESATDAAGRG